MLVHNLVYIIYKYVCGINVYIIINPYCNGEKHALAQCNLWCNSVPNVSLCLSVDQFNFTYQILTMKHDAICKPIS